MRTRAPAQGVPAPAQRVSTAGETGRTVLPLTVPQSSRSLHQRVKTVALKKERMKVTNVVHMLKKASQSWNR
jgi:hypothetical protein